MLLVVPVSAARCCVSTEPTAPAHPLPARSTAPRRAAETLPLSWPLGSLGWGQVPAVWGLSHKTPRPAATLLCLPLKFIPTLSSIIQLLRITHCLPASRSHWFLGKRHDGIAKIVSLFPILPQLCLLCFISFNIWKAEDEAV